MVVVFSQDLINQGREKVVEATNSVAAARIQPLEDIISAIVSGMDNPGLASGVENIKHIIATANGHPANEFHY